MRFDAPDYRQDQKSSDQKALIREEFTRQAAAYNANPSVADPARVARLVAAVNPAPDARVLDIATGPGFVALGFATVCAEVVGLDLTEAPLALAEQHARERGLTNARFQVGDAEQLPFEAGAFDVVVCRNAFHHFEDPERVFAEMVRVCQPRGKVAVEDLISSEHPARSDFHTWFEQLRDPSHTRACTLRELLTLFASHGFEVEHVGINHLPQDAERWMANSQTPPDRAEQIRALLRRDAAEDLSGTQPYLRDDRIFFFHHIATVVGRGLPPTSR